MAAATVIIINYNSGDRLTKCLACLARQTFTDFTVTVVDNASSDGSVDAAKSQYPQHNYILAGANLGFAAANNLAAKSSKSEWLVFLNPDAYAEPSWLSELSAATARYPHVDAFGSTQIDADAPLLIDGAGDVMHVLGVPYRCLHGQQIDRLPPEGECFSPCAAAAMYRRTTFENLGGFDERFFCYGEDVDLGFRLRLAGGRAVQVRAAVVHHEGSGVTGRHSDFTVYHGHRNRIWLTYKNFPAILYWLTAPFRMMTDIALGFKAAAGGYLPAYLRALRDGYGGMGEFTFDRRELAKARKISVHEVAEQLVWSLFRLARRT
ncbi:MAG: glycosyltransferase family 2 protein [Parvularculaceae bacterium]